MFAFLIVASQYFADNCAPLQVANTCIDYNIAFLYNSILKSSLSLFILLGHTEYKSLPPDKIIPSILIRFTKSGKTLEQCEIGINCAFLILEINLYQLTSKHSCLSPYSVSINR